MKIYNLRKERRAAGSFLVADIECGFSESKELWFSVDAEYEDWLTSDVYDSFLVTAIWPAMCWHEDIEIDGPVSEHLYFHIKGYLLKVLKDFRPKYRIPEIRIKGFAKAQQSSKKVVATGFSGGIDSFTTIYDRYDCENNPDWKINTLFFFNIGQNGDINDPSTAVRARARYELSKKFADEIGLPYVFMDSNMFELYKRHWEYDAGPLCRVASILVFQRVCRLYYLAASYHYLQQREMPEYHTLDAWSDSFIYYWLSTECTRIVLDGGQYTRPEKTEHIKDYQYLRKYLNVCVKTDDGYVDTKNCSMCHKCQRTMIALDALGILDDFKEVFNIPLYRKNEKLFVAYQRISSKSDPFIIENLKFAKEKGLDIPSYFRARLTTVLPSLTSRLKKIWS